MKKIITLGDELLATVSEKITEYDGQLAELINDMFESMDKAKGIGLAAIQIGVPLRLFVTGLDNDKPRVFINPDIIETSMEQDVYEEGCLSIPGINHDVVRPLKIKVQAFNEKGRLFSLDADDLLARVIQHEYDHLNGRLFIDRIDEKERFKMVELYNRKKGYRQKAV